MVAIQNGARAFRSKRTFQEKVLAHAAKRLIASKPPTKSSDISGLFRTFLKIEDQRLKTTLRFGAPGRQTAAARSFVLDLVVESAFCEATRLGEAGGYLVGVENECALVALGGYGRAELAPYSDLDILFLHTGNRATQLRQLVEPMLRLLWDAGLTLGQSGLKV